MGILAFIAVSTISILECDDALKTAVSSFKLEPTRVQPAFERALKKRLAVKAGVEDRYLKMLRMNIKEGEAWERSEFDQPFEAYQKKAHESPLPDYRAVSPRIPRAPKDIDEFAVQEVIAVKAGDSTEKKYAFRPFALDHMYGPMVPLKSRASLMIYRFSQYLLGNQNQIPWAELVRLDGEVGILSEWIEGEESPADSREDLMKKDYLAFVQMQILNFVFANQDIFWQQNTVNGQPKQGWRGVFSTRSCPCLVFDYNLAPYRKMIRHADIHLFGTTLPDAYPKDIIDRLVALDEKKLTEMEFFPAEIDAILFFRDVVLEDFELRGRPILRLSPQP